MTISRVDPAYTANEREMLLAWLEYHRNTLEMKCSGLSPEQMGARSAPPSSLSLLWLIRHMAEVERHWFQRILAGEEASKLFNSHSESDGNFENIDAAGVNEAFYEWHGECERSRVLTAQASSLDAVGKQLRQGERITLRWILVHMIEEYARHNGHADLLRERIDGSVGV